MVLLLDTREPNNDVHPWLPFLPSGWRVVRGTMPTGDLSVAALPDGAVVERKSAADLAGCIGRDRERFTRELVRSRYCGRFLVVCEGTLQDVIAACPGITPAAVEGTIAAWVTRFAPIVFAGSIPLAASIAFRALACQVRDINRGAKALAAQETL